MYRDLLHDICICTFKNTETTGLRDKPRSSSVLCTDWACRVFTNNPEKRAVELPPYLLCPQGLHK